MASGHEDIPNKPDCSVPNLRTKQEFNDEIDRLPKDTKFKPQSLAAGARPHCQSPGRWCTICFRTGKNIWLEIVPCRQVQGATGGCGGNHVLTHNGKVMISQELLYDILLVAADEMELLEPEAPLTESSCRKLSKALSEQVTIIVLSRNGVLLER